MGTYDGDYGSANDDIAYGKNIIQVGYYFVIEISIHFFFFYYTLPHIHYNRTILRHNYEVYYYDQAYDNNHELVSPLYMDYINTGDFMV